MNVKTKKNCLGAVIALLMATMLMALLPTEAEARIYDDTLRLHILANSDTEEDQALKLSVRDKILEKYSGRLRDSKNMTEAETAVRSLISEIERDAEMWIRELGYGYSVKSTLTREWYDTREYESFTLPCGYYDSLQIIIGNGNGRNWWCVMYPPLCLDIATERAPADDAALKYTNEELLLISGQKYNIKFKILEIVSEAFAKNG